MTSKSILVLFLLLSIGCATSKSSYDEVRNNNPELIEVSIGSSIFSSEASRMFLTKEGKLISEKRNFLGSWKIKSIQISSLKADSIFAITSKLDFYSLPESIDQNCTVSFHDRNQVKKSIGGTITDQPTKSIRFKNPNESKIIVWKECHPLSENKLEELKTEVDSEDEYKLIIEQNEQISSNLSELNSFLNTMFSLNN